MIGRSIHYGGIISDYILSLTLDSYDALTIDQMIRTYSGLIKLESECMSIVNDKFFPNVHLLESPYSLSNRFTHSCNQDSDDETQILTSLLCPICDCTDFVIDKTTSEVICSNCNVINSTLTTTDQFSDVDGNTGKGRFMHNMSKSDAEVKEFIELKCKTIGISDIISSYAFLLYYKVSDYSDIDLRNENRLGLIGACIKKSSEIHKEPRSVHEIINLFIGMCNYPNERMIIKKKINKGVKILRNISINSHDQFLNQNNVVITTDCDFLVRHAATLKLTDNQTDTLVTMYNNVCKLKLVSSHHSHTLGPGILALYIKRNSLDINLARITTLFHIKESTFGKISRDLEPYYEVIVSDRNTEFIMKKFQLS